MKITNFPTNNSPTQSDYVVTDNGSITSKTQIGSLGFIQAVNFSLSNGATTYNINVPSSSRHLVILNSITSSLNAIYIISANSSGSITCVEVYQGNNIISGTATNTLKITTGSSTGVLVEDLVLSGTPMSLN